MQYAVVCGALNFQKNINIAYLHERRFKNVWSYFTYSFDHQKDDVFWHWVQNAGVDDIHVTVGQIANELGFALSAHILSCTLMNQAWKLTLDLKKKIKR